MKTQHFTSGVSKLQPARAFWQGQPHLHIQ